MQTILLQDFGILPNTGKDYTQALWDVFCSHRHVCLFQFAPGTYHFDARNALSRRYALSNSDDIPLRKLGLLLQDMQRVVLDGNGAQFLFSGQMQPITLDGCQNVTLRNFSIDWEKPMVAEGIVTDAGAGWFDLSINQQCFPCYFRENWLFFDIGGSEVSPLCSGGQIEFDRTSHKVADGTGDCYSPTQIYERGHGLYRFEVSTPKSPTVGNWMVLRHGARQHAALFCENSRCITYDTLSIHSCGGLGCLFQFSQDICCRRVVFSPAVEKGRHICSGRDDGLQFSNCGGGIEVDSCAFYGLMDDAVNVHGTSVKVTGQLDARTVRCRYIHPQSRGFLYWARPGQQIAVLNQQSMVRLGVLEVSQYTLLSPEEFDLQFSQKIPSELAAALPQGTALENLSNTPSFHCHHSVFGSGRARGVLFSTPKPVLLEHNLFDTSGCAILASGDANAWYESGACHDVTIRRNIFTDHCLSSDYQFCEGVISFCPEIPTPSLQTPFHQHAVICQNQFYVSDVPILYAASTQSLQFTGNQIRKSACLPALRQAAALFRLAFCQTAAFSGNTFTGPFMLERFDISQCGDVSWKSEIISSATQTP